MLKNGALLCILVSLAFTHIFGWPENYIAEQQPKPYEFQYNVFAPETGDFHGHEQTQDLTGLTSGSYYLLAPDGEWQETSFIDSGSGFNAVTKRLPKDDLPDTIRRNKKSLAMYFALGGKNVLFQDSNIGVPVVDRSNFLQPRIPRHFTSPNPITAFKPKLPSPFSNSISSLNFDENTDTFKPSEFLGPIGPSRPSGPSSPYEGIHVKRTVPKRRSPPSFRPKSRFENKPPKQSKSMTFNETSTKSPLTTSNAIKTKYPKPTSEEIQSHLAISPAPYPIFESRPFKLDFGPFSKDDGKWKIGEMIEDDEKETRFQNIKDNETPKRERPRSIKDFQYNFDRPSRTPRVTSTKETISNFSAKQNTDLNVSNKANILESTLLTTTSTTSTTPLSLTRDIKAITTSLPQITTHISQGIKNTLSQTFSESNENQNTLLHSLKVVDDDINRFPQQIKFRPSRQYLNKGKSYLGLTSGQRNRESANSIQPTLDPLNSEKNVNSEKKNLNQEEFIKFEKNEVSFNKPFESKRVKPDPSISNKVNKLKPETLPRRDNTNNNKFKKFKAVSKGDFAKEISSAINKNREERKRSLLSNPFSNTPKDNDKFFKPKFVRPTNSPLNKNLQNDISLQQNIPKFPKFPHTSFNQNFPKIPQFNNVPISSNIPKAPQSNVSVKKNKPVVPHLENISLKQHVSKVPQSVLNSLRQIEFNNSQRFILSNQNVPSFTSSDNNSLKQNLSKFLHRENKFKKPNEALNKFTATTTPRTKGIIENTAIPKHNIPNLPQIDFDKLKKPGEVINKVNYIHLKGLPPGLIPHLGKQLATSVPTPKPTNRIVLPRTHKIAELLRKLSKERPDLVSTKPISPAKSQPTLPNDIVLNIKSELKSITASNSDANTDQSMKQETFVVSPLDSQLSNYTIVQNDVDKNNTYKDNENDNINTTTTTTTTITSTTTTNNNNHEEEENDNENQTAVTVSQKEVPQKEENITEFAETSSRNMPVLNDPESRSFPEPPRTTVVRGSPGAVKTLNPMPMDQLNKVKSKFIPSKPVVVKDYNGNPTKETQYAESVHKPVNIDPRNEESKILSQSQ